VRGVAARRHVRDHVLEAVLADVKVALPAVGVDLSAAGDVVEDELGVSEELCKRDRKDSSCLQPRNAGSIKKKMFSLSARGEATPEP